MNDILASLGGTVMVMAFVLPYITGQFDEWALKGIAAIKRWRSSVTNHGRGVVTVKRSIRIKR